jgi:hypothetical protein
MGIGPTSLMQWMEPPIVETRLTYIWRAVRKLLKEVINTLNSACLEPRPLILPICDPQRELDDLIEHLSTNSSAGTVKKETAEGSSLLALAPPAASSAVSRVMMAAEAAPFAPTSPAASFDCSMYVLTDPMGYVGLAKMKPPREVSDTTPYLHLWGIFQRQLN